MSLVSFVAANRNSYVSSIEEALDLIGFKFRKNLKTAVIKPNLCYYWHYTTGKTTESAFISALIDVIRRECGSDVSISIVESDASAMKCDHVFKFLGYDRLAEGCRVNLLNLSREECNIVKAKAGNFSFPLMIPRVIHDADVRINVPKLKYASKNLGITCALKNLYGCNPFPKKYKLHQKLVEAIVAINKAMPFDLCLLDGNMVAGMQTKRLGLVMASEDSVAFDSAAARIAGLNPNRLEFIKLAQKEGLGTASFTEKGLPLDRFRAFYPSMNPTTKLKSKIIRLLCTTRLNKKLGM